jgi:hypothetical protein
MKEINQNGPMYFKYILTEVSSTPSPEAKACNICQTLLIKEEKHNMKAFNLHVHVQLTKSPAIPPNPKKTSMLTSWQLTI